MPDKYGRGYILTIEPAYDVAYDVAGDNTLSPSGQAGITIAPPITVDFSIRRDTLASSNVGTFRIYNLAEETRNQLYKDKNTDWIYMPITFQAGYGVPLPFIFKGNIMEAKSYRTEGSVDFITEITAYDMGIAMSQAMTSKSFPGGTKQSTVIEYLIGDLKKYYVERGVVSDYSAASYDRQRILFGPTWDLLQTEKGKGMAFIDNGKVHVLKDGDAIDGPIPTISSDTGLLGSPAKADNYMVADILFEPSIICGQLVDLESRVNTRFNGKRQVIGVQHTGTISEAVGGKCRTHVTMYYNVMGFKTLSEAMAS